MQKNLVRAFFARFAADARLQVVGLVVGTLLYTISSFSIAGSLRRAEAASAQRLDDVAVYDRTTHREARLEALRETRWQRIPFHLLRFASLAGSAVCVYFLVQTRLRKAASRVKA